MMKPLGKILIEMSIISEDKLSMCLAIQKRTKSRLGQILLDLNLATEEEIAEALSYQTGLAYYPKSKLRKTDIWKDAFDRLGLEYIKSWKVLPVENTEEHFFLITDPFDIETTDEIERMYPGSKFCICAESSIQEILSGGFFPERESMDRAIIKIEESGISSGEINHLISLMLENAISKGVSDIHIEPFESTTNIRHRIDGILYPESSFPADRHVNLANILFSMAKLPHSEFHRFLDGKFSYSYAGRDVEIRISSVPSLWGPSIVLRLLDKQKSLIPLARLGYSKSSYNLIKKLVKMTNGIILITGPTGCGKTTTLYSILSEIKSTRIKIVTVEDPVEMNIPLLQQTQINEKAGITFASATRGFLRQDPDVMLIGEIRDRETAQEAIRAAISGRLIFSTLHTASAVDSIIRLLDLGIHSSYICSTLIGVMAQKLLRILCPFCKQIVPIENMKRKISDSILADTQHFYTHSNGCSECSNGYKGRIPVSEVLTVDDDIRLLIQEKKNSQEIIKCAMEKGFQDIAHDAFNQVEKGITSLEEVERVLGISRWGCIDGI